MARAASCVCVQHWNANSQFQQISPLGVLRNQYISSCTGKPLNYNKVTHECRVDPTDPSLPILSTRYTVRQYPNVTVEEQKSPHKVVGDKYDTFVGSEIVKWDRQTGEVEKIYDMFDFAAPASLAHPNDGQFTTFTSSAWNTQTVKCSGGESLTGVE